MKKFIIKEIVVGKSPTQKLSYAKLIDAVLKSPATEGFTTEYIRKAMRVEGVLKDVKIGSEVQFEDADYGFLLELVKKMKWGIYSNGLVQFEDDLIEAAK